MSVLDRVFGRKPAEKRTIGGQWISPNSTNTAGVHINESNATSIAAVYASVKLYADTVASLPWGAYIRDAGVRRPVSRPRWMDTPIPGNPNFTSFDFKHRITSSLLIDGNAFILVLRAPSGDVVETRPLDPQKVTIESDERGNPLYKVETTEGAIVLTPEDIIHIALFATGEKHRGLSPIEAHRVTLGLASATQMFSAKFYENGTTLGGIVKVPGELTQDQADALRNGFSRRHEGIDKAWRVAVLTGGADFTQLGMKVADLQLVETMHYGVEAIARIYGIPLHLLQYPGGNTSYASTEVITQAWLVTGLGPLIARIEAGLQRLIVGDTTFVRFTVEALMKTTTVDRINALVTQVNNGLLTINEARAIEDRVGIGPEGDRIRGPLNIAPVDGTGQG
jgi:HK97 family phage portal protein